MCVLQPNCTLNQLPKSRHFVFVRLLSDFLASEENIECVKDINIEINSEVVVC